MLKINKTVFLSLISILCISNAMAQTKAKRDSAVMVPLQITNYSFQWPGGDMKKRFGPNSAVGFSFFFKTQKNWMFGTEWSFLFSNKVRERNMFDNLKTSSGHIINKLGEYSTVRVYERGHNFSFIKVGKVLPILAPNKNSGLVVLIGAGFLQHKIRIEDADKNTYALAKAYLKGYDRLSNGPTVSEFIGYLFLDRKKFFNFFGGFEFTQAFTKNRRSYNFDTMQKDTHLRLDLLSGFRIGFVLPIYRRTPDEFYYN